MRKSFVILAVILQLIVLAYMAGEREYILHNGKVIHLRTAPIDPRDMFRGDYVRLNYEISRIPVIRLKGIDSVRELKKGDKIFVSLKEGPNGLYELADAGMEKPADGIYLAGRLPYPHRSLRASNPIWINYGIEASSRAGAGQSKSAAAAGAMFRSRWKWKLRSARAARQ